jgi:hypothetical protein
MFDMEVVRIDLTVKASKDRQLDKIIADRKKYFEKNKTIKRQIDVGFGTPKLIPGANIVNLCESKVRTKKPDKSID